MEFKRKQPPLVEAAQGDTTGNWKSQLDRSGDMHKKIDNQCGTMAHQVKHQKATCPDYCKHRLCLAAQVASNQRK